MAQTWTLGTADRIDVNSPNLNLNEATALSDRRVEILEKLKQSLQGGEGQFVNNEKQYLRDSLTFLNNFWKANEDFVRQEEENIKKLQAEIDAKRPEQEKNDAQLGTLRGEMKEIEDKIEGQNNELRNVATKRKEICNGIDPAELSSIKFKDPLDTSNDLFRWVLEAIYGESKANYYWENFKKNAFKKDKGADFMARLKGLNTAKLRKDNFAFGKDVFVRKDAIIAELEPKKKQNNSLRALFDYIGNVVAAGDLQDKVDAEKGLLETKSNEVDFNHIHSLKTTHLLKSLEDKVKVSAYYVETLRKLKPLFENARAITDERIRFQEQYALGIQGNTDAIQNLLHSSSQIGQSPGHRVHSLEQNYYQSSEQTVNQKPHEPHGDEDAENQKYSELETVKENKYVAQEGEEEHFEGQHNLEGTAGRKVERNVPTTDLKESEFANSKKGGCETCNIF